MQQDHHGDLHGPVDLDLDLDLDICGFGNASLVHQQCKRLRLFDK